jgi:hypothetical protein
MQDCLTESGEPFFELFSNQESQSCLLPSFVDEQVSGILEKLPGCNPLTDGPEEAPVTQCAVTSISEIPEVRYFTDVTKTLKWEYIGCGTDNVGSRTFTGASQSSNSMTVQTCVNFCQSKGFKYAGLEYSSQYVASWITSPYFCFCSS